MSTITGQKSDGSHISFNFKLENGLPFKPMIEPEHKYYYTKNKTEIVCSINLTDSEILNIGEIKKVVANVDNDHAAIFLEVNDKYVLIQNVPRQVLEAKQEGRLTYQFYKKEHNNDPIGAFG